jgi:transposase
MGQNSSGVSCHPWLASRRAARRRHRVGHAHPGRTKPSDRVAGPAVKISSMITNLHGMIGRDIMDHLIAGERDPRALAELARGKARPKIGRPAEALEGAEFFTREHAALVKVMLDRIDRIDADITRMSAVIEELLAPMRSSCSRQSRCPAGGAGPPRTSWPRPARTCPLPHTGSPGLLGWPDPLDRQSGQRAGKARRKHGNRYLGAVTGETSAAAGKTQTREGTRYRRIARRCGPVKANVALGNTQMRVYHVLLSNPACATPTSDPRGELLNATHPGRRLNCTNTHHPHLHRGNHRT